MSKKMKTTEEEQPSPDKELVITAPGGFPDDLLQLILLNAPATKWLIRCRKLNKSYNRLISSTPFLRKFLFQNSDYWNDSQVLIQRRKNDRSVYSLHSHASLRLRNADRFEEKLDFLPGSGSYRIVCGCRGLFCLSDGSGEGLSNIALWNPETSQTMVLPVSSFSDALNDFGKKVERIWFGFDPETDDYKVFRTLFCTPLDHEDGDDDQENFTEVYSLRNAAWSPFEEGYAYTHSYGIHNWVPCHDGKSFYLCSELMDFVRLNMSSEVFDYDYLPPIIVPLGSPLVSFSIVKGSVVLMFIDGESLETWILLDFDCGHIMHLSTTNMNRLIGCPVGIWRDGRIFFQRSDNGKLVIIDLTIGKIIPTELQIEGDWLSFKVFPYTPSQVSLL